MLMPDVTAILDDPEVGGGVSFDVIRTTNTRTQGTVTQDVETIAATGNIQPAEDSSQPSTVEDLRNESIVIYSTFCFSAGVNNGGKVFTGPDEILWEDCTWRVTRVDNWAEWGFTRAYATKVR